MLVNKDDKERKQKIYKGKENIKQKIKYKQQSFRGALVTIPIHMAYEQCNSVATILNFYRLFETQWIAVLRNRLIKHNLTENCCLFGNK